MLMTTKNDQHVRVGDVDSRTLLYTELTRTGGDPSFLFELLEGIVQRKDWNNLLDEDGNPVGSLRRLIEAPLPTGCGQSAKKIVALLKVEHRYERNSEWRERMKALRKAIEKELGVSTQRSKIIEKLEDQHPDLAAKVSAGEISANAAAIEAGYRRPRVAFYADDVNSVAEAVKKNLDQEQMVDLINLLRVDE